ncbi:SAF domain-containing protein [Cellulomonas sp. P24]|uniref:SAF domain-containing protein n=1 Tax=Cellulomonas sp. P24 TaxID=2885206 RepID=UPI00216B232C|nr:SAF domain-containing protein [Cellulomonas sp. P24]MCR6490931.1 SAF domain-containing protein [Cellulomonas sp. P24]
MTTSAVTSPVKTGRGTADDTRLTNGSASSATVPNPPRARRRWGLFAAMVLVVALGALGNVWLLASTTTAQEVVAARSTIERGSVIAREDLMTVRIELDPSLHTVAGGDLAGLVGQRAALDVAAGSLVTTESVTKATVPSDGNSLVGIGVAQARMPGVALMAGDRVRVVATPAQATGINPAATPVSVGAVVVGTQAGTSATGAGAETIVTVQVPTADSAALAGMAATGNVALVLDSRER